MKAEPFPHFVGILGFPEGLLADVLTEFPAPDADGWRQFGNAHECKMEGGSAMWGSAMKQFLVVLESFGPRLSVMFGIPDLSLEMVGGGYHLIPPGGFLGIHTDFNRSPKTKAYRRLNVLTYLNETDPGGHLELWDHERCVVDIPPMFGTTVAFETSDYSWHGHPTPTTDWRRSVAGYFYSPDPPPGYRADHSTVWFA